MVDYNKPLPTIDEASKGYWEGCKRHELRMQRCRDCGFYCFPPLPMCPRCNSVNRYWDKVSGKGKIYAWFVVHHATHPDFMDDVPYMVVVVRLDDQSDLHVPCTMINCTPEDMKIDLPVEVIFDDVTDEITLPRWKLASS